MNSKETTKIPDIAFVDTETTSLRYDRQVWEVGIIKRVHGDDGSIKHEAEHQFIIKDVDLHNADPISLKICKFHERFRRTHPKARFAGEAFEEIFRIMQDTHLVGSVPGFDDEAMKIMLRQCGLIESWHYHLLDVENLIVGYLRGIQHSAQTDSSGMPVFLDKAIRDYNCQPPWNSEELSNLIGVDPPTKEERHTALGDAQWTRRVYDRVMGLA